MRILKAFLAFSMLMGQVHTVLATEDVSAAAFPEKPITVVVPFPPGGGVDILFRAVAVRLAAALGQPVIVENKPGAASLIGAEVVARAPSDGYTLLAAINQTLTSNRFLFKKLPYDPDAFAPISLMTGSDQFLLVNADAGIESLSDAVELASQESGPLAYGSFGNGSQPHLLYEMLKFSKGIDLIHVPYRGVAPALIGLAGGEIQLGMGSANVAAALIEAKKIKPIAVAGEQRSRVYPDVPTTAEQGYPELQATIWYALLAPVGTPAQVVAKVSSAMTLILEDEDFQEKHVTSRGLEVLAGGPEELIAAIKKDVELTRAMVDAAGMQPE